MRSVLALSVVGLTALALPAHAQDRSPDEQAIRDRIQALESAWNARDARGAAAVHADDGDLAIVTSPVYRGRAAIQRAWNEVWPRIPEGTTITLLVQSIRFVTPDVALVDVDGRFSGARRAGEGFPDGDRAFYVMVRRQGSWHVAALRVFPAEASQQ